MESGPERARCMGCGAEFPRADMFGLPDDLRCPPCAEALRNRHHPAVVRRMASSLGRTSAGPDGKATAGVLALMVALWLATVVSSPLKDLIEKATSVRGYPVPEAKPERPPGLERGTSEAFDRGFEGITRAWEEQRFIPTTRPGPWMLLLWAFLHGGIVHLLVNGFSLYQLGRWIEWGWGRLTYVVVLVGSGVFSVAAGWLVNGGRTIGLSGGIFALIGWLASQRRTHPLAARIVTPAFWNSLLANMVLLVVLTEIGGWHISHVGHAAGFLWGLAAGRLAASRRPALGWGVVAAGTLALVMLPTFVEPLGWDLTLFRRG